MSKPLTKEERKDINRRATGPQWSIHKQEVQRLLDDLERVEHKLGESERARENLSHLCDVLERERDEVRADRDSLRQDRDAFSENLSTAQHHLAIAVAGEGFYEQLKQAEGERDKAEARFARIMELVEGARSSAYVWEISDEALAIAKGER